VPHTPPYLTEPGSCSEEPKTQSSIAKILHSYPGMVEDISVIRSVSKSFSPNSSFPDLKSDTSNVAIPKVSLLYTGSTP